MSNLENITQKILEDAKKQVAEIKVNTGAEIEKIIKTRVDEAVRTKDRILERAKQEAVAAKDKIISTASLKSRDQQLSAKQRVMDKVFELSKQKLINLSDEDYKKFVDDRLKLSELSGDEIIIPQKGRESLFKNSKLKVSDSETVESGFAIQAGKTIINHNFNDLVDFNRLDLEGEIAKILFDGKE